MRPIGVAGYGRRKRRAPVRRVGGARRRPVRRSRRGRGWFSSLVGGIKSAANSVGNAVKSGIGYVRDNNLISKGLNLAGSIDPRLRMAGNIAGRIGLGRRRVRRVRRVRRKVGGRRRRIRRAAPRRRGRGLRLFPASFSAFGLGRRRRVIRRRAPIRRRRAGRGLMDLFRKAHSYVKSNKLVSRGLDHFKQSRLGNVARSLGYGRRRRVRRRIVRRR
jgi:hypothetical protein